MNTSDLAAIQPLLTAVRTIELRTIAAEIAAIVKRHVPECDAVLLERNNLGDWSFSNIIVRGKKTLPDTWLNSEDERVWAAETEIRPLLTHQMPRSVDPIVLDAFTSWHGEQARNYTSLHLIPSNTAALDSAAVLAADEAIAQLEAFKAALVEGAR